MQSGQFGPSNVWHLGDQMYAESADEPQGSSIHTDDEHERFKQIFTPVHLQCGRTVVNRLAKVALYEHLGDLLGSPPNAAHLSLYSRWSRGQWGMIITGNVQVSPEHLSLGRDIVVPTDLTPETIDPFKQLADSIHGVDQLIPKASVDARKTLAVMQVSHAGRQSVNILGGRKLFVPPLAPSAVVVGSNAKNGFTGALSHAFYGLLFQTPRAMSSADIDTVVDSFVRAALLAALSGFDGVQLHAAHGYLLSQFISPKTNLRDDEYSARTDPLRLLHRIASAIRGSDAIPKDFVVGVKLNAADYVDSSDNGGASTATEDDTEDRALRHVQEISSWGMVDFIEVSGGDYEDPEFITKTVTPRQAYFAHFAQRAVQAIDTRPTREAASSATCSPVEAPKSTPLILLTGGLRTLPLMSSVLEHNHAHLLGIGRLSVVCPELPLRLSESIARRQAGEHDDFLMEPLPEPDVHGLGQPYPRPTDVSFASKCSAGLERGLIALILYLGRHTPFEMPKLVGANAAVAWYNVMMRRISAGQEVDYTVGGGAASLRMWLWTAPPRQAMDDRSPSTK